MFKKISEIFEKVLHLKAGRISLETTKSNLHEWDSMKQLELILEIEKEFSIKFTLEEMISIDSITKLIDVINHKRAG